MLRGEGAAACLTARELREEQPSTQAGRNPTRKTICDLSEPAEGAEMRRADRSQYRA